jgi:hypothetical protein
MQKKGDTQQQKEGMRKCLEPNCIAPGKAYCHTVHVVVERLTGAMHTNKST